MVVGGRSYGNETHRWSEERREEGKEEGREEERRGVEWSSGVGLNAALYVCLTRRRRNARLAKHDISSAG